MENCEKKLKKRQFQVKRALAAKVHIRHYSPKTVNVRIGHFYCPGEFYENSWVHIRIVQFYMLYIV